MTAALTSAVLFGGTFVGVSTLAFATGRQLQYPRAVALLTAGYSVGQIIDPVIATPLLYHSYHSALILSALIVLAALLAASLESPPARFTCWTWSKRPRGTS